MVVIRLATEEVELAEVEVNVDDFEVNEDGDDAFEDIVLPAQDRTSTTEVSI